MNRFTNTARAFPTFATLDRQDPFHYSEAAAVAFFGGTDQVGQESTFALAGYGWRDSAHGYDSLSLLYDESTSPPNLRWSAWLNQTDVSGSAGDTCMSVAMDCISNSPNVDDRFVYVTGQKDNGTELQWRSAVYTSQSLPIGVDPYNPANKSPSGGTIELTGSVVGTNTPFKIELMPLPNGATHHDFLVIGTIYDGPTAGDDVVVEKLDYSEN